MQQACGCRGGDVEECEGTNGDERVVDVRDRGQALPDRRRHYKQR